MTHHFHHEAMATGFEVIVADDRDEAYLRQAAAASFREVDRLENELSRFVEASDIARINRSARGQPVIVSEDTMTCLIAAARVSETTSRAFDPAYAAAGGDHAQSLFALDPSAQTVTSLCDRLHLDLGAVGKGYALDRMADVLRDWNVGSVCLQSGGSTVLALAAPPGGKGWPVTIHDEVIVLAHRAASASGTSVHGRHLMDPRTGNPAPRIGRVWSFAGSAAVADALSTAFFVMGNTEISNLCQRNRDYAAVILREDGTRLHIGSIPTP